MNILYILHTMIRNVYAQYAFILDYSKARSKKGHGEISQIKMFNPNLKHQVILHELLTYYISYKGI